MRQFADWGANVIKIEAPEHLDASKGMGGVRDGPDYQNIHRNKRGMTLNLKNPDGVAVFNRLVEAADVPPERVVQGRDDVEWADRGVLSRGFSLLRGWTYRLRAGQARGPSGGGA